jgi:hypothetical protein
MDPQEETNRGNADQIAAQKNGFIKGSFKAFGTRNRGVKLC